MAIDIQPEDERVFKRLKSRGRVTQDLRRLITQQWNKCSNCGASIAYGRPAFAGYNSELKAVFAGVCCADLIQELATPVYWTDSLNLSVGNEELVWRYMDLAKFVSMMQMKGLYLSRADKFEDRFEGATGLAARQETWENFYRDFFREVVVSPPPGYPIPKYTADEVEAKATRLMEDLKRGRLEARQQLVSCWHGGETEAEALWRLYTPQAAPGIAIKSTVGKLWDACNEHSNAIVGRVHYVDFKRSFASIERERIFQKRKSLSHEQEIRIVLPNDTVPVEGKFLACDLEEMVTDVVISPFAPLWSFDVVARLIQTHGYAFELKKSELVEDPFF